MRPVHQLVATAAPYDAVTNDLLALRDALRGAGHPADCHAENVHPAVAGAVRPLDELRDDPAAVLVLHYSIWSAAAERALAWPGPLVVRYHNVTPPEWFAGVNEAVADLCRTARDRLGELAPRTVLALADSTFNARDLVAAGYREPVVEPILLPAGPRTPRQPDADPLVLAIGRIVPNKRVDEVLRVFACLQRACLPSARLVVVGGDAGFEAYGSACRGLARRLGIDDPFAGAVDDAEKAVLLSRAACILSCSEHEGFCVPIVEAMRADVPVVARAFGAVAETLGGAGIAAPPDAGPAELAELVALAVADPALGAAMARGRAERLGAFAPERVAAGLVARLGAIA